MAFTERYVSVAGGGAHDGTSEANAWTLAEGITNEAAGQRVNVKAGTYTNTTNDRTLAATGLTTAPIWWRGYKTAIGDMDGADTSHGTFMAGTEIPALSFTTGRFGVTGSHHIVSNIDDQGAQVTNGQLRMATGAAIRFHRVRVECTAANANGRAVSGASADVIFDRCWFKSTSSAPVVEISVTRNTLLGSVLTGGSNGLVLTGANVILAQSCIFDNCGGDAIRSSISSGLYVINCSIYSPASDGIELTALPGSGIITGNIFSDCGGVAINNSSGANTNLLFRGWNLFHNSGTPPETGFGDSPSFLDQTDVSSPFTNAAGGDFTPVAGSNAINNGIPGTFEGL